jgi:hypothetical protein
MLKTSVNGGVTGFIRFSIRTSDSLQCILSKTRVAIGVTGDVLYSTHCRLSMVLILKRKNAVTPPFTPVFVFNSGLNLLL